MRSISRAQRVGGERAGGQDSVRIGWVRFEAGDFFADDANGWLGGDGFGDAPGKLDAIDGQRVTGGDGGLVRNAQQGRTGAAHLLLEQPGRGVGRLALERVGADQFAEIGRLVGGRAANRPHLEQLHGDAPASALPGRLRAGQTGADNANGLIHQNSATFPRRLVIYTKRPPGGLLARVPYVARENAPQEVREVYKQILAGKPHYPIGYIYTETVLATLSARFQGHRSPALASGRKDGVADRWRYADDRGLTSAR